MLLPRGAFALLADLLTHIASDADDAIYSSGIILLHVNESA